MARLHLCDLNCSSSKEFYSSEWIFLNKTSAAGTKALHGWFPESNRTSVSHKCFDGVSDWSGFLQTASGNLTLTFTSTCSRCALWGHRAPLRWVRGQRNETPCQQDFSLMRYFDKVNYIQQTHKGGKTLGDAGRRRGSVHAVMHYSCFGLQLRDETYRTAEAAWLMQSWNMINLALQQVVFIIGCRSRLTRSWTQKWNLWNWDETSFHPFDICLCLVSEQEGRQSKLHPSVGANIW